MRASEKLGMKGLMKLVICDADGSVVEEREHPNTLCLAGLSQFAAAAVWAAAADQNAAMGSPLSTQVMYPVYGAVGSGTTAASFYDTQLATELGRAVLSEASYSGNQILFTCFFGTTTVPWSMTEVGMFVSGSSTATATANSGLLLNHSVFAAVTKTAAQTCTLQASFTF